MRDFSSAVLRRDTITNVRDIALRTLAVFGMIIAITSDTFADEQAIVQYAGSGSTARALFPANDLLDWGQLGPPCPNVGQLCIPNGRVATSNKGIALTIFSPSGGFNRADEGTIAWAGHFQTGDHVIYAGPTPGTITFTLQRTVSGIAFELGPNSSPTVSATVKIFDSKHKLLSSLTQPTIGGACIPACDNAAFFGFYDPKGRIASVAISPNDGGGYAENQVSLIDQPMSFAGTPGQPACYGQSVAALAQQYYSGLDGAVAALGFSGVTALQNAVMAYCGG
jgi:hypothetical protein